MFARATEKHPQLILHCFDHPDGEADGVDTGRAWAAFEKWVTSSRNASLRGPCTNTTFPASATDLVNVSLARTASSPYFKSRQSVRPYIADRGGIRFLRSDQTFIISLIFVVNRLER